MKTKLFLICSIVLCSFFYQGCAEYVGSLIGKTIGEAIYDPGNSKWAVIISNETSSSLDIYVDGDLNGQAIAGKFNYVYLDKLNHTYYFIIKKKDGSYADFGAQSSTFSFKQWVKIKYDNAGNLTATVYYE